MDVHEGLFSSPLTPPSLDLRSPSYTINTSTPGSDYLQR
jgi:hypothetical protein